MSKSSWQDHFKSSITNAESLYSKDATNISFLLFCLRAKMLPVQEYLNWAKETFQLPVLSAKFFQLHPPQKEFFKKWQKVHSWSVECLPIAEWDGALIIACLEKPTNYKNLNPTIFVLASHEVLDTTWLVYQKSERSNAADLSDMTAFAATVVAPPSKEANFFNEDGSLNLQAGDGEESAEESSEESVSEESSSEGEEVLELSGDNSGGSPEGLFTDVPISLSLKKGPRSSEPIMSIDVESLGDRTKIDAMVDIDDEPDQAFSMPEKKTISPVAQVSAGAGDLPSAPVKPTTLPGGTAAYLLEKLRKQSQEHFDKETLESFQQLKTFFKKSMLLAIGDKDRLVKPLIWDNGFESPPGTSPEFNLKTPSIFKIVNGTQKPYHGFVVVNDLNESFFESWNHGQVPDHVTIVPLMDGDLVVGMLMGLGEKSSYNKNVLQFTENIAKNLSQKILKSSLSKAA